MGDIRVSCSRAYTGYAVSDCVDGAACVFTGCGYDALDFLGDPVRHCWSCDSTEVFCCGRVCDMYVPVAKLFVEVLV